MNILDQVLGRAVADSGVRGVILTGSRARGTATARSDHDVTIVAADQAEPWRHNVRTDRLDEAVCTVQALADTCRWNKALRPDRVRTAALRLFPAVEALARRTGHADVLDGWGGDVELIRTFAER